MIRAGVALVSGLLLCGCLSAGAREVLGNVVTLQQGTLSDLRDCRGTGPFRTYPVPPDQMIDVLVEAAGKGRDETGRPIDNIWPSVLRREVVAKERGACDNQEVSYSKPFKSAMYAVVHPIPGQPDCCQVEIHATDRGPLHQGRVNWSRDMPGWIEAVLATRAADPAPVTPMR